MKNEIQALPDKAIVIRVSSFDDGTDDNKPALLRTTETRDGDTVTVVKEVMPKNQNVKGWQFRNQTRLSRATG